MGELLDYMQKHLDCTDIRYGFQVNYYDLETAFTATLARIDHFNVDVDLKRDAVLVFLHQGQS
jgi:hypothetical protein